MSPLSCTLAARARRTCSPPHEQPASIVDDEPAAASVWMPVYAGAIGAPPPRSVPEFLVRWFIGKPPTSWVTTVRGASNERAKRELGWTPGYASWRAGFGSG